jgi:TolA-binding protein
MPDMGIYDGLKDAASILKEAGKIEQYRQILEVQEKLLEMQKRIADLEEQNKELRQQLETRGQLHHKGENPGVRNSKSIATMGLHRQPSLRDYLKNTYLTNAAITRTRTITASRPKAPIPHIMSGFIKSLIIRSLLLWLRGSAFNPAQDTLQNRSHKKHDGHH